MRCRFAAFARDWRHRGIDLSASSDHVIVLPGGGYAEHAANEAEPIAQWLQGFGVAASVFRYPLMARHPAPLNALRAEIRRVRAAGSKRIGVIGFSAGGHLAGHAALADGAAVDEAVDFAVLGYSITSMETESYRPARLILLGEDASPELRRAISLNALVTTNAAPFFIWHTAEDLYVPVEHALECPRFRGQLSAGLSGPAERLSGHAKEAEVPEAVSARVSA